LIAVTPQRPRLNLIVAWARERVIGRAGALPWHLPEDLRRFRRITMGYPILMGRATWDSIGRPLPGRRSIVLTRNPRWSAAGCETAPSLEQALAMCEGAAEVFVIGGAQVFERALPGARRLFLTRIDADFPGDVHFPPIDLAAWRQTACEHLDPGPGRPFAVDYITLEPGSSEPTVPAGA